MYVAATLGWDLYRLEVWSRWWWNIVVVVVVVVGEVSFCGGRGKKDLAALWPDGCVDVDFCVRVCVRV